MSQSGETRSDCETREAHFKCAITKKKHRKKNNLSWLQECNVVLRIHGGNEIEMDIQDSKRTYTYKLSSQNLCGIETGRIMVPTNNTFCCFRRQRRDSYYVLVAMDDNCGNHPIILLTHSDSQIINHWKWHLQNTLTFVNSWPNLSLVFITADNYQQEERVTLMLTKTWLSIFKFQSYKLPELWHRIRIATITDLFLSTATQHVTASIEESKPNVAINCNKGLFRVISSRADDIHNTIEALWRVDMNPTGGGRFSWARVPHPAPPPCDSVDGSSMQPRSEQSSGYSGKTDPESSDSRGPGCAIHSNVIMDLMERQQQDSSGRISVSCTGCLQSGTFSQENPEDDNEVPPVPCSGKFPIGDYIDRTRYMTMEKRSQDEKPGLKPGHISADDVIMNRNSLNLNERNAFPYPKEEEIFITSPPYSWNKKPQQKQQQQQQQPTPSQVKWSLETIPSESDEAVSMEITQIDKKQQELQGKTSDTSKQTVPINPVYSPLSSLETKPKHTMVKATVSNNGEKKISAGKDKKAEDIKSDAIKEPRENSGPLFTSLNLTVNDRISNVKAPHIRSDSKPAPQVSDNGALYKNTNVGENREATQYEEITKYPSHESDIFVECPPGNATRERQTVKKQSSFAKTCLKSAPTGSVKAKATTLPRGHFMTFKESTNAGVSMDMNKLGRYVKLLDQQDADRVIRLMSSQTVTKAQFDGTTNLLRNYQNHYIGLTTDILDSHNSPQSDSYQYKGSESSGEDIGMPEDDTVKMRDSPRFQRPRLRRCNSMDTPRRGRPTSSLYIYFSASNIVHTLYRVMRNKPPQDTLGLSTKERKELCMRLFTSKIDEGIYDWRKLAEFVGLSAEAVWIIEKFQENCFSKNTAGEIVLKHWQFCHNTYGDNKEKCPVPCTQMELIGLLNKMGREDLITQVLGRRQVEMEVAQVAGPKSVRTAGKKQSKPVANVVANVGTVNHAYVNDDNDDELFTNVDDMTVPKWRPNMAADNFAFQKDEAESSLSFDNSLFQHDPAVVLQSIIPEPLRDDPSLLFLQLQAPKPKGGQEKRTYELGKSNKTVANAVGNVKETSPITTTSVSFKKSSEISPHVEKENKDATGVVDIDSGVGSEERQHTSESTSSKGSSANSTLQTVIYIKPVQSPQKQKEVKDALNHNQTLIEAHRDTGKVDSSWTKKTDAKIGKISSPGSSFNNTNKPQIAKKPSVKLNTKTSDSKTSIPPPSHAPYKPLRRHYIRTGNYAEKRTSKEFSHALPFPESRPVSGFKMALVTPDVGLSRDHNYKSTDGGVKNVEDPQAETSYL